MLARSWCVSPMLNYETPPTDKRILPDSKTIAFTDFLGKCWSQGRPSRLFPGVVLWWASPTGERLPPGESLQVLLSVAFFAQIQPKISPKGERFHPPPKTGVLPVDPPPWRVHLPVAKKCRHGVMESWLLPWSSFADVSSSALAAATSWPYLFLLLKIGGFYGSQPYRDPFFFPDFDEAMSIYSVMSKGFFSPLLIMPMAKPSFLLPGDDFCGTMISDLGQSQHSDFLTTTVWSGKMRCIFNMFFPFI